MIGGRLAKKITREEWCSVRSQGRREKGDKRSSKVEPSQNRRRRRRPVCDLHSSRKRIYGYSGGRRKSSQLMRSDGQSMVIIFEIR